MGRVRFSQALLVAVAGVAAVAGQAQASTVVISDNLVGTGGLNGHVASTGQAWTAPSSVTLSSSGVAVVDQTTSQIPFTLTPGAVYTLSADIDSAGAVTGIGFQSGTGQGAFWGVPVFPWAYIGSQASQDDSGCFFAPGGGDPARSAYNWLQVSQGMGFHHLEIVLDTTGAQWTLLDKVDGIAQHLTGEQTPSSADGFTYTYPVGQNPVIDHVAVTGGWAPTSGQVGTITNFQLTSSAVPEPASLAVLGLAGLFGLRRRRHA